MKPHHYALLTGALLAACSPTDVSTAPSGATGDQLVLETIPAKFRGTWTYKQDGKHPPGGENPTVIGATTWTGHESEGQVKSVRVSPDNDISVTMAMSGEGETWVDHSRLRLSPDGNVLTVVDSSDQVTGTTVARRTARPIARFRQSHRNTIPAARSTAGCAPLHPVPVAPLQSPAPRPRDAPGNVSAGPP